MHAFPSVPVQPSGNDNTEDDVQSTQRRSHLRKVCRDTDDGLHECDGQHGRTNFVVQVGVRASKLEAEVGGVNGSHTEAKNEDDQENGDGVEKDMSFEPPWVMSKIAPGEDCHWHGEKDGDTRE
jgi:hypothetical protein